MNLQYGVNPPFFGVSQKRGGHARNARCGSLGPPGADLDPEIQGMDYEVFESLTGKDGRFRFEGLTGGCYSLSATLGHQVGIGAVKLGEPERLEGRSEIRLMASSMITGTVKDLMGLPVANARVIAVSHEPQMVMTDREGRFTLDLLPAGEFFGREGIAWDHGRLLDLEAALLPAMGQAGQVAQHSGYPGAEGGPDPRRSLECREPGLLDEIVGPTLVDRQASRKGAYEAGLSDQLVMVHRHGTFHGHRARIRKPSYSGCAGPGKGSLPYRKKSHQSLWLIHTSEAASAYGAGRTPALPLDLRNKSSFWATSTSGSEAPSGGAPLELPRRRRRFSAWVKPTPTARKLQGLSGDIFI